MMPFITVAGSLTEPESDVVLFYKIYGPSGNRTLAVQRSQPALTAYLHPQPTKQRLLVAL